MKTGTIAALAAGGGFLAGAVLMAFAAQKQQKAALAAIQAQQQQLAGSVQPPQLQLASSTSSLNNGWMYYVTVKAPGTDLSQTANQSTVQQAIQQAGFVDPSTKQTPSLQVSTTATDTATALTTFTGTTGTSIPASTATLLWVSVLGYPPPEGLATA